MMFQFDESLPVLLLDGVTPLPMNAYLLEVVMSQPYWRASAEGLEQAEEILDQIDSVRCGDSETYTLSKSSLDALRDQMKLAGSSIVSQNPHLVRPSIRFGRKVQSASRVP